jgi:hypothetical protein
LFCLRILLFLVSYLFCLWSLRFCLPLVLVCWSGFSLCLNLIKGNFISRFLSDFFSEIFHIFVKLLYYLLCSILYFIYLFTSYISSVSLWSLLQSSLGLFKIFISDIPWVHYVHSI